MQLEILLTCFLAIAAASFASGNGVSSRSWHDGLTIRIHESREAQENSKVHELQHMRSKATQAEIEQLLKQVSREFEPWKSGISLDMVEKLYCTPHLQSTMRIQIIGGKPFVVGQQSAYETRAHSVLTQMLDLSTRYRLPDVDFIISAEDNCQEVKQPLPTLGNASRCTYSAPLFSFCRREHETSCVRVPDYAFAGWPEAYMPDWQRTRAWMLLAASRTPFENRTSALFWRGANTNSQRQIMDGSPAVQNSELADVHLMHWEGESLKNEWISLPEHCQRKHLLHLRGNGWAGRLRVLLLCGSSVIYPADHSDEPTEFWYHMMKDGENIIFTDPVDDANVGTHIMDIVQELNNNASLAEAVGRQGQHLAGEILHIDNIHRYWIQTLTHYSKLMTFSPEQHADAVPIEIALMQPLKTFTIQERTCSIC